MKIHFCCRSPSLENYEQEKNSSHLEKMKPPIPPRTPHKMYFTVLRITKEVLSIQHHFPFLSDKYYIIIHCDSVAAITVNFARITVMLSFRVHKKKYAEPVYITWSEFSLMLSFPTLIFQINVTWICRN